jgi:hypothetical protein
LSYPLAAAETLRSAEQARAEEALSRAFDERERAIEAQKKASDALAAFRRREAERQAKELARLARGCLGAELARAERFRSEQAAIDRRLAAAWSSAGHAVRAAQEAVRVAHDALIAAAVGVEAIEKHRETWEKSRAKQKERAEENEREENGRDRRGGSPAQPGANSFSRLRDP